MLIISGKAVYGTVSIGKLALLHGGAASAQMGETADAEAETVRFRAALNEAVSQIQKPRSRP